MNWRVSILFLIFFLGINCPEEALCQGMKGSQHTSTTHNGQFSLTRILDSLRYHTQHRAEVSQVYEANLNIRSEVDVLHKGLFPRLTPYLSKAKLSEGSFSQQYTGKLKHTVSDSTTTSLRALGEENSLIVKEFTEHIASLSQRINIYSQYIYGNIFSPLAYSSGKYYDYTLDSTWTEGGMKFHKIVFIPKISNYKFVEGFMVIAQNNWSVRNMHIVGSIEFGQYCNIVQMGEQGSPQEFLPTQLEVKIRCNFLGSKINGECTQEFAYTRIGDIYFLPSTASATLLQSTDRAASLQATATSSSSQTTDSVIQQQEDTLAVSAAKYQMGSFLVKDRNMNINDKGNLYIAPLVSPLLFHYSTHSGLSYTQKLKYTCKLQKERMLKIEPLIGYNFKYNEFYWAAKGDYLYSPALNGKIFIEAGNGVPQDFRTSYAKIGHTIEVAENISLTTNAAQLRYTWLNKEDYPQAKPSYTTFVSEVELQYKKHGYPTFTLGYAHSIKGIFGSDVEFGRAELDIQHKIDVGPMHTLTYRTGLGIAFDYNYLYFAQFKNLKDNHLPHGWHDDIGGTFNLLSSVKYYEIDKYIRANVQYDAPLLLVPSLLRKVKFINKERLYCNLLLVDTMSPYVEMGYGIGTNIFNMGIFWGGEVDKWDRLGVKFTFELFNK